jgi:hypothetical protein
MINDNFLIFKIITIFLVVYYLYLFHKKNKNIIKLIKYGDFLFILNSFLLVTSSVLIYLNLLEFIYYLIPILPLSIWFSYKFYKLKNSKQDYIYLTIILIYCFYIFYILCAK